VAVQSQGRREEERAYFLPEAGGIAEATAPAEAEGVGREAGVSHGGVSHGGVSPQWNQALQKTAAKGAVKVKYSSGEVTAHARLKCTSPLEWKYSSGEVPTTATHARLHEFDLRRRNQRAEFFFL